MSAISPIHRTTIFGGVVLLEVAWIGRRVLYAGSIVPVEDVAVPVLVADALADAPDTVCPCVADADGVPLGHMSKEADGLPVGVVNVCV